MRHNLLLVDDDSLFLQITAQGLKRCGFDVDVAGGGPQGLERLAARVYDLLVVDLAMPEVDGLTLMKHALHMGRSRAAIVVTGHGSIPVAVEALKAGAADFITKPFEMSALERAVRLALDEPESGQARDAERAQWRTDHAPGLVGDDPNLLRVLDVVARVAKTECSILITGESGTGKELIARAVHAASGRGQRPFVPVNCAAIPKELIESEMFGHARGAFTGATERREGRFALANGGTFFLDEIGEMDVQLQSKLLRVLQDKEVTPVGEAKSIKIDTRVISATNKDLGLLCRDGRFRQDLYYRINVIPIHLTALRERPRDIARLADHFLGMFNQRYQCTVSGFTAQATQALREYNWPGNVRELANLLERLVLLKGHGFVGAEDLPGQMFGAENVGSIREVRLPEEGLDLNKAMEDLERRLTTEALSRSGGNKAKAAQLLGLKRTTLIERLRKLNLADSDLGDA